METMPVAPEHSTWLRVTSVHGTCAHGFAPGNTWSQGNLSRLICAAAAEAFKDMYRSSGKEMPDKISCECPLAVRNVEFDMEAFESKELE